MCRSTVRTPAWVCELASHFSLRHAISLIERRRQRPLSSWRGFQAATLSVENVFLRYSITDIVFAGVEDECSPPQTRCTSLNSPLFYAVRAEFIFSLSHFTFCFLFAASVWGFIPSSSRLWIRSARPSVCPSIIDLASSQLSRQFLQQLVASLIHRGGEVFGIFVPV